MPFSQIKKEDIERMRAIAASDGPLNPVDVKAAAAMVANVSERLNRLMVYVSKLSLAQMRGQDFHHLTVLQALGEVKDTELPK